MLMEVISSTRALPYLNTDLRKLFTGNGDGGQRKLHTMFIKA